MLDKNNEVFFEEYCKTCKYKNYSETDSPCEECIAEPVNLYSHKPVKWEGVDTLFNQPPKKKDHDVERAVRQAVYLRASDTAKSIDKQSNLESRVHMRDLISCAVDCVCDVCKDGFTYTYGQMEDVLHSIITGEFHSNEKVITRDHTLGYTRWLSADLPNATEISDNAFQNNPLLNVINIPKVTKIGYGAFAGTTSLWNNRNSEEDTKIFENIESIDFGGFMESGVTCDAKMYSYYYPLLFSKLTEAGTSSFYRCSKLLHIQMDIIPYIASNMFAECAYLRQVTAPEATIIKSSAFARCKYLDFEYRHNPMPKVTEIEYGAFEECVGLERVTFENVTKIGSSAFGKCYTLTEINLPNLVNIGNYAFECCYNLPNINLPNLVTLGSYAFQNCTHLNSIDLPNVKTVGELAFSGCASLLQVGLESVKVIGDNAFMGCYNLRDIRLDNVESLPVVSNGSIPLNDSLIISVPLALYEQFITHPVWRKFGQSILPKENDMEKALAISITCHGPGSVRDLYGRELFNSFHGISFWFDPSSYQDKPSSQYYYMIEPFGEDIHDVLSLTDNGIDCTDSLETIYTDIHMFEIENVDSASYGFVEDSSGWYVSQNKGVKSSAALCKVVFNTTDATTIKFKVINYAEANYDYGIFSNIDASLSTTSAADDSSRIFWNGKSQHSASEKEITYQIPAGQHFIYIKYLKDGSADKNNDCLKFKIATENKVVRRTKKYKYTIDLSSTVDNHEVHVVFARKKDAKPA